MGDRGTCRRPLELPWSDLEQSASWVPERCQAPQWEDKGRLVMGKAASSWPSNILLCGRKGAGLSSSMFLQGVPGNCACKFPHGLW